MPLGLFRNRNFSLGHVATGALGAAMTAQMVPSYFYLQAVRDLSPTKAALVFAPMAVVSAILSPVVGKISDKVQPRYLLTFGFGLFTLAVLWFVYLATPDGSIPLMLVMSVLCGIGSSCIWAPLPATALRSLPLEQMGAASGVYNTTRQVGSVLGSAGIGALLTARLAAHSLPASAGESGPLPDLLKAPYASALTDSLYLTVILLVVCVVTAAFFAVMKPVATTPAPTVEKEVQPDLAGQH
ncbi:hypothetical protein JMUB6875_33340 [Nocardia sp. JMUB6875]|uniref:MFS transporter n=1 Tax=Nocardia sp. JMUB6875 TaxID=3158170 RepID=UPI0032E6CC23